jgi:hypothetical protein
MFRNYDGNGAAFGDTVIRVDSDQSGILSVYASVDSTDDLIKLLMINKSPDTTITLNAIVRGVVPYADVKSYVYGAHTPEGIVEQPPVELNGTRLKQVLAPYSMTLVTMARSAR